MKNKLKSVIAATLFGVLAFIGSIAPYAGTATVIAGAAALSAPTPAAAEVILATFPIEESSGPITFIIVYLSEEGDSVMNTIIDFAYFNGIDISISCAPGLVIQDLDGYLTAVRF